jgi:hypothetical protein
MRKRSSIIEFVVLACSQIIFDVCGAEFLVLPSQYSVSGMSHGVECAMTW